jgi:hypothetical protein
MTTKSPTRDTDTAIRPIGKPNMKYVYCCLVSFCGVERGLGGMMNTMQSLSVSSEMSIAVVSDQRFMSPTI